jgi:hypothetical protein
MVQHGKDLAAQRVAGLERLDEQRPLEVIAGQRCRQRGMPRLECVRAGRWRRRQRQGARSGRAGQQQDPSQNP